MPVSTKRFSELRYAISEQMQMQNWKRLLEICGASDPEESKSIAVIFSLHRAENVWKFVNFALGLSLDSRREHRNSIATICYSLGRMGQSDTQRAISSLRSFLASDHMLKLPVEGALSNLWVLDTSRTSRTLLERWIIGNREENDDLTSVAISSSTYLAKNDFKAVLPFFKRILEISQRDVKMKPAAKLVQEVAPNLRFSLPKRMPSAEQGLRGKGKNKREPRK